MKYYCDNSRHLVCIPYSIENLHKMANDLGIKKCWFHKNHYDIPKKRVAEIKNKCIFVSSREIVNIIIKMRTVICPKCNQVIAVPDHKDFVICCNEVIYAPYETHDCKDDTPDGVCRE